MRSSLAKIAVVVEEVVQPLVAEPLDVVAADVVHRLRPVAEADQPAVDQLADRPLEARLLVVVAPEDGVADHPLEVLVPEAVQAVLAEQVERDRQLLADHEERVVRSPARLPRSAGPGP